MLLEASDVFDHWNLQTRALAIRVFDDPSIDTSRIGVPLVNLDETGGATSNAAIVSTYTNGQFLADFLLLAQASLRGLVFTEPLDISERSFSVGLDMQSAIFKASLICKKAVFGPFSYFEMLNCVDADFSMAEFFGTTSFTMATFTGTADFTAATFHGPFCTVTAFESEVCFNAVNFEADVDFCGTLFTHRPDFSGTDFKGNTTFADAIFEDGANFDGASFPGRVWVQNIPADVRERIEAAEHP